MDKLNRHMKDESFGFAVNWNCIPRALVLQGGCKWNESEIVYRQQREIYARLASIRLSCFFVRRTEAKPHRISIIAALIQHRQG
jgi:hypothetical protein